MAKDIYVRGTGIIIHIPDSTRFKVPKSRLRADGKLLKPAPDEPPKLIIKGSKPATPPESFKPLQGRERPKGKVRKPKP